MKKIILSTVAITTMAMTGANADTSSDIAEMKAMMKQMSQRLAKLEAENTKLKATQTKQAKVVKQVKTKQDTIKVAKKEVTPEATAAHVEKFAKAVPVFSKASKLKFSGLTYLGYTNTDHENGSENGSDFEIRRAYLQLKAYLMDDPKSYYRVTFDMDKDETGDEKVRAKYAYVYLNDVFAYTGVEVGLVHRPWHDYEEHNAWYYRNINKVLVENKNGAHLSNSADYGVMFKTKTDYFDADYGIFSGEGYHGEQNGNGMSFEWRATAHILGVNGKDKQTSKTYFDASFFGQYNQEHKTVEVGPVAEDQDLHFYGLHTVYNQPEFLISAQYIYSDNTSDISGAVSKQAGEGYSVNGEYRLGENKQFRLLARYDSWTPEYSDLEQKTFIGGLAWEQYSNLQWVANITKTDNEQSNDDTTKAMITAEVRF